MKRNTTPQWLDFLSAPNNFPFTLNGHEFSPPGVLHCTEIETVRMFAVKGKLYVNVFHMTED